LATFLKLVQSSDTAEGEMFHRVPGEGLAEIPVGSVAVVEDNQAAVFFQDGNVRDVLGPGRHVLSPGSLPGLSKASSVPPGKGPFESAVYFVNLKVFTGMKWGTRHPVAFRDRELGEVQLRASGVYTMRVVDPARFVEGLVGTRLEGDTTDLDAYLKDVIGSRLNDLLGDRLTNLLDLPALYNEFATETRLELREDFARFGVQLIDFFITSVVPTEDVQKVLDERANTSAPDSITQYLQYQAAKALGRPATPGDGNGASGNGFGIGVGAGLGLVLPQAMIGKGMTPSAGACPTCQRPVLGPCPACHKTVPPRASFCPNCGADQRKTPS
jgi:membrane protease subunit (stomatin/prohibitin family)